MPIMPKHLNPCRLLAGLAMAALACAQPSFAQDMAKVLSVEGVSVVQRPGARPRILGAADKLAEQDVISVVPKSHAIIEFSDKTQITFRPGTIFRMDALSSDKPESLLHGLLKGGARITSNPGTARAAEFDARLCEDDCAQEDRLRQEPRGPLKPVARVVEMKGVVAAARAGAQSRILVPGAAIHEREGIATGANSYAVLLFSDGARVTLAESSHLAIPAYRFDDRQRTGFAELHHLSGGARVQSGAIAKQGPAYYRFVTPMGEVRPHGTGFDSVAGAVKQAADKGADTVRETGGAIADTARDTASQAAQTALNTAITPILQTMSALMTGLRDNPPTTEAGWNELASKMTLASSQLHGALDGARRAAGAAADSDAFKSMVGLALAAELEVYAVGASIKDGGIQGDAAGPAAYSTLMALVAGAKASPYQSESLALVGLSGADLDRVPSNRYVAHTIIEGEVGGFLASQGNAAANDFFSKAEAAAEKLRLRAIEDAQQAEAAATHAAEEAEQRAILDEERVADEARDAEREAERLAAQAAKEAADKAKEAERLAAEAAKKAADKAKEAAKVLQALEQIRAAEREFAREVSDLRNALKNATNLSEAEKQRVLDTLDEWSRLVGEEVARLTAEVMKNPNAQIVLTSLKIMAIVVATVATVIVAGAVMIPLAVLSAVAHTAMTNPSVFEDVPASTIAQATQSTDQAAEAMRALLAAMVEHGRLGTGEAQQFMATLGQTLAGQATQAADNAAQTGRDVLNAGNAGKSNETQRDNYRRAAEESGLGAIVSDVLSNLGVGSDQADQSQGPDRENAAPPSSADQRSPSVSVWDGSVEVAGHVVRKGEALRLTTGGDFVRDKSVTTVTGGAPRPDQVQVDPGLLGGGEKPVKPGLYVWVRDGAITLNRSGSAVEVAAGNAVVVTADQVAQLDYVPNFLRFDQTPQPGEPFKGFVLPPFVMNDGSVAGSCSAK